MNRAIKQRVTEINSLRDIEKEFTYISKLFLGKETEQNWEARDQAVKQLRGVLNSDLLNTYKENIVAGLHAHMPDLIKPIHSLRTSVALEGLSLILDISITLGNILDQYTMEIILSNLLKSSVNTKKLFSTKLTQVTQAFLANSKFHLKMLVILCRTRNEKNVQLRQTAADGIKIIMESHGSKENIRTIIDHCDILSSVDSFLKKGLVDASLAVRDACRNLYNTYKNMWSQEAESLCRSLDSTVQKQLLRPISAIGRSSSMPIMSLTAKSPVSRMSSAVSRTPVLKPSVSRSATLKSTLTKPAIIKSIVSTSSISKSPSATSSISKSIVTKASISKSIVTKASISKSIVTKATKSSMAKPIVSKSTMAKPVATKPTVTKSSTIKPPVTKLLNTTLTAKKPLVTKQERPKPDATIPETHALDTETQETPTPDVSTPEVIDLSVSKPSASDPITTATLFSKPNKKTIPATSSEVQQNLMIKASRLSHMSNASAPSSDIVHSSTSTTFSPRRTQSEYHQQTVVASASLLHMLKSNDTQMRCKGLGILAERLKNTDYTPILSSLIIPPEVPSKIDLLPILMDLVTSQDLDTTLYQTLMSWESLSCIFTRVLSINHYCPTLLLATTSKHPEIANIYSKGLLRVKMFSKRNDSFLAKQLLDLYRSIEGDQKLLDTSIKSALQLIPSAKQTLQVGILKWMNEILCDYIGLAEDENPEILMEGSKWLNVTGDGSCAEEWFDTTQNIQSYISFIFENLFTTKIVSDTYPLFCDMARNLKIANQRVFENETNNLDSLKTTHLEKILMPYIEDEDSFSIQYPTDLCVVDYANKENISPQKSEKRKGSLFLIEEDYNNDNPHPSKQQKQTY